MKIYSSTFYVQTWILFIKEDSEFVYERKPAIYEFLYITNGLIGGLIPYKYFLKNISSVLHGYLH